jgi:hypothetical protein
MALALVPAGLGVYCGYLWSLTGDPLAWLHVQAEWGYFLGRPPWEQLLKMLDRIERYGLYDYFFVSPLAPYRLLHGVVALIFLMLTPLVFKQLGMAMGLYVLVSLLVPLSANALEGVGRYAVVLFPVFMVVAATAGARTHEAIVAVNALFLSALVVLFVTLHPIY